MDQTTLQLEPSEGPASAFDGEPVDRLGGVIDPIIGKSVGFDHVRPRGPTDINRHHSTGRLCTTSDYRVGDHHNGSRIRPPVHSSAEYPCQSLRSSRERRCISRSPSMQPDPTANPRIHPRVPESPRSLFLESPSSQLCSFLAMNWRHFQERLVPSPYSVSTIRSRTQISTSPARSQPWNQSPESSSCQKRCLPPSVEPLYLPRVHAWSNC